MHLRGLHVASQASRLKHTPTISDVFIVGSVRRASKSPRDVAVCAAGHNTGGPQSPRAKVVAGVAAVFTDVATEGMVEEGPPPQAQQELAAADVVRSFFRALNARDISGILNLVSDDIVHHDLAHEAPTTTQLGVARFYSDLISSISHNIAFVVEEMTLGDPQRVGVTWRMEVEGAEVPMGKGLSFYRINQRGRICYVRQSPEHFIKCAGLATGGLGMASPFIGTLGPAALPSFWTNVANAAGAAFMTAAPAAGASATDFLSGLATMAASSAAVVGGMPGGMGLPFLGGADPAAMMSQAMGGMGMPGMGMPGMGMPGMGGGVPTGMPAAGGGGSASVGAAPRRSPGAAAPAAAAAATAAATVAAVTTEVMEPATNRRPPAGSATAANNIVSYRDVSPSAAATAAHAPAGAATAGTPGLSEGSADEEPPLATASQVASSTGTPVLLTGVTPEQLVGVWVKDAAASELEAYERALDLWQISGMQKATARLIEGLELSVAGSKLSVHFLTIIPMFKVTENYDLSKPTKVMRRDLRPGDAHSTAERLDSGVKVVASWKNPLAGGFDERYELRYASGTSGDVELAVTSTIRVGDKSEATTQVYRRQAGVATREAFIRASEARNGKANDILRKHGMPV